MYIYLSKNKRNIKGEYNNKNIKRMYFLTFSFIGVKKSPMKFQQEKNLTSQSIRYRAPLRVIAHNLKWLVSSEGSADNHFIIPCIFYNAHNALHFHGFNLQ